MNVERLLSFIGADCTKPRCRQETASVEVLAGRVRASRTPNLVSLAGADVRTGLVLDNAEPGIEAQKVHRIDGVDTPAAIHVTLERTAHMELDSNARAGLRLRVGKVGTVTQYL